MGQPDRERHEIWGVVTGVAEHHSLIAGALGVERVLAARAGTELEGCRHALADVRRLLVERDEHSAVVPVEAQVLPVVADLTDRLAHDSRDVDVGVGRDLAGDERRARS